MSVTPKGIRDGGDFYASNYEQSFISQWTFDFNNEHWEIPIGALLIYLSVCYFGQIYMADRKPFDLSVPLALWNAFLSVFSYVGMLRLVPRLISILSTKSYQDSLCLHPRELWADGVSGFWMWLFMLSKIPELMDTVFIVLRKKDLLFLHWYHHVTVLLYCWDAYSKQSSAGIYFAAMNYTVHAMMYGYFFGQTLKIVPKWFPSYLITGLQIAQMIVGVTVCVALLYYKLNGVSCLQDLNNLYAGSLMYASYLLLFMQFAVRKFGDKKDRNESSKISGKSL